MDTISLSKAPTSIIKCSFHISLSKKAIWFGSPFQTLVSSHHRHRMVFNLVEFQAVCWLVFYKTGPTYCKVLMDLPRLCFQNAPRKFPTLIFESSGDFIICKASFTIFSMLFLRQMISKSDFRTKWAKNMLAWHYPSIYCLSPDIRITVLQGCAWFLQNTQRNQISRETWTSLLKSTETLMPGL